MSQDDRRVMLVLSRAPGETVVIGDQIRVTVVRIAEDNSYVELAINSDDGAPCRVVRVETQEPRSPGQRAFSAN